MEKYKSNQTITGKFHISSCFAIFQCSEMVRGDGIGSCSFFGFCKMNHKKTISGLNRAYKSYVSNLIHRPVLAA